MSITPLGNKIKSASEIKSNIKRIAYQVYENNVDESSLVVVGIGKRGGQLALLLGAELKSISALKIIHVTIEMDKSNPRDTVKSSIPLEEFKNQSIVIVDDVLNTGSTLIYAVNYFLQIPVKQINTAVMVNRNHKKFPIKAIPTIIVAIFVSFSVTAFSITFLKDSKDFLDLEDFNVEDIDYEFQTILEESLFDELVVVVNNIDEVCEYFAQSGSFRTYKAAQSQFKELEKIGYFPVIENVNSKNGYNYIVIVGPFENRSQTNNARENLRRLNMDSLEKRSCKKI